MADEIINEFEDNILLLLSILEKIVLNFEKYTSDFTNIKISNQEDIHLTEEENKRQSQEDNRFNNTSEIVEENKTSEIVSKFENLVAYFDEIVSVITSFEVKNNSSEEKKNKISSETSEKKINLDNNFKSFYANLSKTEESCKNYLSTVVTKGEKIYSETFTSEKNISESSDFRSHNNLSENLDLVFSDKALENHSTNTSEVSSSNINNSLSVSSLNIYTQSNNPDELAKNTIDSLQNEFNSNLVLSANTGVRVKG